MIYIHLYDDVYILKTNFSEIISEKIHFTVRIVYLCHLQAWWYDGVAFDCNI